MNFGLCLLVKEGNEGLNRNEINGLLAITEGDSYYPIEFCNKENEYVAMGFISSGVANSIDYSYKGLHNFIAEILSGVKDKSDDCRYRFREINIWMCADALASIKKENIKEAVFTSVWDDGIEVATKCKVNMDTKEVYDVERTEVSGVEILEEEYVIIDGVNYPVSQNGEDGTEYWYD